MKADYYSTTDIKEVNYYLMRGFKIQSESFLFGKQKLYTFEKTPEFCEILKSYKTF